MRDIKTQEFLLILAVALLLTVWVLIGTTAFAQSGLSEITAVLQDTGQEAKTSVVPAVSIILGVVVLIGVGAGIVRVVSRST